MAPVACIALDDTERVYPEVLDSKIPSSNDSVLKGFRQLRVWNVVEPLVEVICGCTERIDTAPAMRQGDVSRRAELELFRLNESQFEMIFGMSDVNQPRWQIIWTELAAAGA